MTTIQVSNELKDKLKSFGTKDDTYETIINRIYEMAVKEQLRTFLYGDSNTVTVDEARRMIDEGTEE